MVAKQVNDGTLTSPGCCNARFRTGPRLTVGPGGASVPAPAPEREVCTQQVLRSMRAGKGLLRQRPGGCRRGRRRAALVMGPATARSAPLSTPAGQPQRWFRHSPGVEEEIHPLPGAKPDLVRKERLDRLAVDGRNQGVCPWISR